MTEFDALSTKCARVNVLIPVYLHHHLTSLARVDNISIAEKVRRLIEAQMPPPPASAYMPPAKRSAPSRAPTSLELFERHFTATQIAAMTRKPYAQVLAEIGRAVDGDPELRKGSNR